MTVSTRFHTVTLLLVSALLLTCHSAVTVVEVGVADDSIDPLDASVAMNAPCKKLRSEFSPLVMLYGREVVSSTKDSSAIVLLSDLSWGVVQYLKQCEPHVFSPLNTTGDGSDGGDSNGSRTTSRYLHLFHQEPHYPDISWPVRDSSFTSSQLLADFMQANTPDVEDFEEGDIDDVFPTILVEFSLLSTTDFKFDGTWLGVYSYVPLGFVCELSAQKTQWKHSYQKHAESMAHLGSLQRTFSFFQPIDVNKRADEAEVRLQNFKKMSKRKQKKTSASYSRRYVTSVFQQNDVSQTRAIPGAGDIPFLKAFPVNSVEFAIARQYTDAHTELAMHMITSSLSVSKEIAALNSEFDYFQCARTLDRLLLACDLLTHAVETLSRFSEDVHGEGTYESLKTLFSKVIHINIYDTPITYITAYYSTGSCAVINQRLQSSEKFNHCS